MLLLKPKNFILIVCICFFANLYCSAQTQADFDWINEYYDEILREIFPTSKGLGWTVGFRIHGDLENPISEYSTSFSEDFRNSGNKKIVLVTKSDSVSLLDQLLAIRPSKRKQSVSQIKKQLKVKAWNLTEESCPSIKDLYSEFYNLDLKMLSKKDREEKKVLVTILFHPIVYDFNATISGGRLNMWLEEENHPFIVWANKTRNDLEKCIEQQSK